MNFSKNVTLGANIAKTKIPLPPGAEYQFRLRTISPAGLSGYRETVV